MEKSIILIRNLKMKLEIRSSSMTPFTWLKTKESLNLFTIERLKMISSLKILVKSSLKNFKSQENF